MSELLKDLEGFDCEVCPNMVQLNLDDGRKQRICWEWTDGDCERFALQWSAARLEELGYVKVVRCGECKHRIPSEEEPLTSGYCEIDADCFGAVVNMSIDHFCGHGERVADATGEEVSNGR